MPHVGELTMGIFTVLGYVIVRKGVVAREIPARGELRRSRTGPTGQPARPRLRTRRAEYLGAPGEVRRILLREVEVVMMIRKILLVALVRTPSRAAVETTVHALGKVRLEGVSYHDQPARCHSRESGGQRGPWSAKRWA